MELLINKIIQSVGSVTSILIHTVIFIASFLFYFIGVRFELILLTLTTTVSLEAIYLSLFIQMSVNIHSKKVSEIQKDIDDIQLDIEDIQQED